MRKLIVVLCLAPLLLGGCAVAAPLPESDVAPRNLIFLLGDGMGVAQVKAYRFFADDPATPLIEALPFDPHLVGAVATDSVALDCRPGAAADCVRDPYGITDSASSATAYATGRDTVVGRVGVDPEGEPMPTILQKAKRRGKATGLVVTSQITHASPAAFAAHVVDREQYAQIADQFYDLQWGGRPMVDVLLGGGLADLRRPDRNLVAEFQSAGYATVFNRADLSNARAPRVLGLFAPAGLPPAWDRSETTPSLAEMTGAALAALSQDPDGFFLFVEGSQIDWASHEKNVVGVISEMEDFSAAVAAALEFAAADGGTLVVVTADHETGGLSIGREESYRWDPRPLRGLSTTPAALTAGFLAGDAPLPDFLAPLLPFALTGAEQKALAQVPRDGQSVFAALNALFDQRTHTGWTGHGHTGADVPLYATGPGSDRLRGTLQNEELGRRLQELLLP